MADFQPTERAQDTLPRADKGAIMPAPALTGPLAAVAAVATWPGVSTTGHWDLFRPTQVDGVDFYVGEEELGHIHLDGDIHLATAPGLGRALVAEGLARPFPYARGWVQQDVHRVGPAAAIALFRRNYDQLLCLPKS